MSLVHDSEKCDYSLKQGCLIVYAGKKHSFPSHVLLLLFEIVSAGGVFNFFFHSNNLKKFFIITVLCSRFMSVL